MTMKTHEETRPVILIVDDQPDNIHVLSRLLSDDYEILVATSGRKALEICSEPYLPDVLLLDINMPDKNGYDVCRQLKADSRTKAIPIIFITALSDAADEERGFLIGASDYITKPFQAAVVKVRVRNQVNLKIQAAALEKLAYMDILTTIPNRRTYETNLPKIWNNCRREKQFLTVIMVDIDYFKAFNDHYGHGAGDECLRRVAQALQATVQRSFDSVSRYGGEEFVAVIPNSDRMNAGKIADKMRIAVEDLQIPHEFSSNADHVTISLGCATLVPSGDTTAEELVRKADRALYRAKAAGSNQVHIIL